MKNLSIVLAIMFLPSAVAADGLGIEKCHQIGTDYIRLMCYDKETGYSKTTDDTEENEEGAALEPKHVAESDEKQWKYSEDRSLLDNRTDVWLSVISDNTEGNSIGASIHATLWFRCM